MVAPPLCEATDYLKRNLEELEPASQWGGTYAFKPGYHSTRKDNKNNWPGNYSITDPEDQGGPDNLAAALDWTFPNAQQADYDTIIKYSKRLLDSGKDENDSRLDWMREFYGQADKDTNVEGWDYRYAIPVSSDGSHLWHIHFSFSRDALTIENMDKLLEVLRGDDVALSDADIEKIADKTLDTFLKKKVEVPAEWLAIWPDDPGIQDGTISILTAWRSGYFHGRQTNEELTGGPEALEVPSKLESILAILQAGAPVPGLVNLTPEAIAATAEAVADEVAARIQE